MKYIANLFFLLLLTSNIFGQQLITDKIAKNRFGFSTDLSNGFLIVGTSGSVGSAYIYTLDDNNEWVLDQELIPTEPVSVYGNSVSISYPYAIISAGIEGAFIFEHKGQSWDQVAQLTGQISVKIVSISGDMAVVSDPHRSITNDSGVVFVFQFDGNQWVRRQEIAPIGVKYHQFGHALSVHNDNLIISGHIGKDNKESVSIYNYNGKSWIKKTDLSSDSAISDFGVSVDISDDYAMIGVGNYQKTAQSSITGAVFVYRLPLVRKAYSPGPKRHYLRGYINTQIITNSSDEFGYALNVSDKLMIVGAPGENMHKGAAYVYQEKKLKWVEQGKLVVKNSIENGYFGYSVSISNKEIVMGGPCQELENGNQGHVASFPYFIKENVKPLPSEINSNGISINCFISTLLR